jgi:hypothetical protein
MRYSVLLAAIVVVLCAGGCAQRSNHGDHTRTDGFYGGVTGGINP